MKTEKLTMKATLPADNVSNARNYSGKKETVSRYIVVGKRNGKLSSIVEARFYMGRSRNASTVYCALWVTKKLTGFAKTSSIQLCNYGRRYTFPMGTEFVPDGHCIRAAHMKAAFIVGSFKAYKA